MTRIWIWTWDQPSSPAWELPFLLSSKQYYEYYHFYLSYHSYHYHSIFHIIIITMPQDQHVGVSPSIARSLAEALSVPLQLVPFPGPGTYLFLERENVNYGREKMPLRK